MDVFLLPLERWAKDLEAERELVYDYSRMSDSGSPEQWAPDFTQAGTQTHKVQSARVAVQTTLKTKITGTALQNTSKYDSLHSSFTSMLQSFLVR